MKQKVLSGKRPPPLPRKQHTKSPNSSLAAWRTHSQVYSIEGGPGFCGMWAHELLLFLFQKSQLRTALYATMLDDWWFRALMIDGPSSQLRWILCSTLVNDIFGSHIPVIRLIVRHHSTESLILRSSIEAGNWSGSDGGFVAIVSHQLRDVKVYATRPSWRRHCWNVIVGMDATLNGSYWVLLWRLSSSYK